MAAWPQFWFEDTNQHKMLSRKRKVLEKRKKQAQERRQRRLKEKERQGQAQWRRQRRLQEKEQQGIAQAVNALFNEEPMDTPEDDYFSPATQNQLLNLSGNLSSAFTKSTASTNPDDPDNPEYTEEVLNQMTIKGVLEHIGQGGDIPEGYTIDKHPEPLELNSKFWDAIVETSSNWYHCPLCRERGPHVKKHIVNDYCKVCDKSIEDCPSDVSKFSAQNEMNPFPENKCPFQEKGIEPATPLEVALISTAFPIMKVYTLQATGDQAYKGNVINIEQQLPKEFTTLPPKLAELPIIVVRRKTPANTTNETTAARNNEETNTFSEFKDFRVRRRVVKGMLEVLKETNPLIYGDVQINESVLNTLPENGSVLEQLQHLDEESAEEEISQRLSQQGMMTRARARREAQRIHNNLNRNNHATADDDSENTEDEKADEDDKEDEEDSDNEPDDQQALGPEQGGATGAHLEDRDENTFPEAEYIPQPLQPVGQTFEDECRNYLGTEANPVDWPEQGAFLNDYKTANLQARCFPNLFPYGVGDATNPDRNTAVTLTEATKHLLWYAIKRDDDSFWYPFASDERWMYWAQNTCERHRFLQQKRVYLHQNPEDRELTLDELRDIVNENDQDGLRDIIARMSMFSSNIVGSNSYFYSRRRELEALMEAKGASTFWFSLSAADNHWFDFHHEDLYKIEANHNEKEKARKRRQFVKDHPHIVDGLFYLRVKSLIHIWLKDGGLDSEYIWFRVEYQKRGTAHVHGCVRLKNDPDLVKLGDLVVKGRFAQDKLKKRVNPSRFQLEKYFTQEEIAQDQIHFDESENKEITNVTEIERLVNQVIQGKEANDKILRFNDFLLSTWHPRPNNEDARAETRKEETIWKQQDHNIHPTAFDFRLLKNAPDDARKNKYCQVINSCERHKCQAYCQRKKKRTGQESMCRGDFPHPLCNYSFLRLKQHVTTKKSRGTTERTEKEVVTRLDVQTRCNDRWLNSHCVPIMKGWNANMDIRLTIDMGKIVDYMTKYVTKTEHMHTRSMKKLFRASLRFAKENDRDTASVLRRVMTSVHGERMRSRQETCHLIDGTPMVYCDHVFRRCNLNNDSRQMNFDGVNEEGGVRRVVKKTLIDSYGERETKEKWWEEKDYDFYVHDKEINGDWSLEKFAKHVYIGTYGQHMGKIKRNTKPTVVCFSPNLSNKNLDEQKYQDYCRLSLMRYKPWSNPNPYVDRSARYSDQWEAFINSMENPPDHFIQEIRRAREQIQPSQNSEQDAAFVNGALDGAGEAMGVGQDIEQEYNQLGTTTIYDEDEDEDKSPWDKEFWTNNPQPIQNYEGINEPREESGIRILHPEGKMSEITTSNTSAERALPDISVDDLNEQQKKFHTILTELLRNHNETDYSSTDGGIGYSRLVILTGRGGTGKSTCVNAVRAEFEANDELVTATTGIAATIIGGSTIFRALKLPVGRQSFQPIQEGQPLRQFQTRYRDVKVLYLDEYTMLQQKYLWYIDQRLQQIKGDARCFGGIVVVLIGDNGQLPAVGGRVLWDTTDRTSEADLAGRLLYHQFESVIRLTENRRIDKNDDDAVWYEDFLGRLRDGNCKQQDWEKIRMSCSRYQMTDSQWRERGFTSNEAVKLFTTNKEVNVENQIRLQRLKNENPDKSMIVKIEASNSNSKAKATSADRFNGLQNLLFLSVGSKVVLGNNLCPEVKLANGSTGVVQDIIYKDGVVAPNLPEYVWVKFEKYSGPTFFRNNPERSKWVPIAPVTCEDNYRQRGVGSRTMLPLRLAWAWTIWKAQGQTIKGKLILNLGKTEKECGLSYTAFSRAERLSNIAVDGGLTADRLTTKISKQKKMKVRLEEERRLDILEQQTLDVILGTQILVEQMTPDDEFEELHRFDPIAPRENTTISNLYPSNFG